MGAELDRLLLVGLSHHSAPVEVRERLALDEAGVRRHLSFLQQRQVVDEALLLSTCNRTELYAVPRDEGSIQEWIHEFRTADGETVDRFLYRHRGTDAVRHLFRVTSSLDALVVGEPQILGQVKQAAKMARDAETLGRVLQRLVDKSFSVAKRVRTETAIGRHRVGIGNAGVDLAQHVLGNLKDQRVLLVGAGKMGREVARALVSAGVREIVVANRSPERAQQIAAEYGGTPISLARLRDYLARVDIAITAATSSEALLTAPDVQAAIRERFFRPLVLIDLAVPRNIDAAVGGVEEAFLFNVDDLAQVVAEGREAREEAKEAANQLVDDEVRRFSATMAEVDAGPRIGAVMQRIEAMRQAELERSQRVLDALTPEQREGIDRMTSALVKKILNGPLQAARKAARDGDSEAFTRIVSGWEDDE